MSVIFQKKFADTCRSPAVEKLMKEFRKESLTFQQ